MLACSLRAGTKGPLITPILAAWQTSSSPSCSGRDTLVSFGSFRTDGRHCSTLGPKPDPAGVNFQELFSSNPSTAQAAAQALATKLTPAQRAVLASALAQHTDARQFDEKYFAELFKAHDIRDDGSQGLLTKEEFQAAIMAHSSLLESQSKEPPTSAALRVLFFASAIPFIVFGFLDNAIMLVAGEEIDNLFGVRLGLSTLASAGLGNAVADVISVGAAKYIEQVVRWLPSIKEPKLSKYQQALPSTQRAKLTGAMVGVCCGCLLGLTPLFLTGSFFTR